MTLDPRHKQEMLSEGKWGSGNGMCKGPVAGRDPQAHQTQPVILSP